MQILKTTKDRCATDSKIQETGRRLLRHPRPCAGKGQADGGRGHKIIKLNIGNLAVFGFDPPDEIVQDMILNLHNAAGYTDSKGMFAPRKAIMHYTQGKHIAGVTMDDIYIGNGASE